MEIYSTDLKEWLWSTIGRYIGFLTICLAMRGISRGHSPPRNWYAEVTLFLFLLSSSNLLISSVYKLNLQNQKYCKGMRLKLRLKCCQRQELENGILIQSLNKNFLQSWPESKRILKALFLSPIWKEVLIIFMELISCQSCVEIVKDFAPTYWWRRST